MYIRHNGPLSVFYLCECGPDFPYPPRPNQAPHELSPSSPILRHAQLAHPSRRQNKIFQTLFHSHRLRISCVLSLHFVVRHKGATQPSTSTVFSDTASAVLNVQFSKAFQLSIDMQDSQCPPNPNLRRRIVEHNRRPVRKGQISPWETILIRFI